MPRQERSFEMRVPAEQAPHLVDHGRNRVRAREFVVRVRRDPSSAQDGDRITAHWPSSDQYDNPPQLIGRIVRRPDGLTITGTIRESRSDALWAPAYTFVTALMGVIGVIGVVALIHGDPLGGWLAPVLISLVGGPLFWLRSRRFRRDRRPRFERQADNLDYGIRIYLRDGAARRPD